MADNYYQNQIYDLFNTGGMAEEARYQQERAKERRFGAVPGGGDPLFDSEPRPLAPMQEGVQMPPWKAQELMNNKQYMNRLMRVLNQNR